MCPLTDILLASLAVYRVARMVSREHGPANVFVRLRSRFGATLDPTGDYWYAKPGSVGDLLCCEACLSIWFGGIAAVLLICWPALSPIFYPFAISALALVVRRVER